MKSIEHENIFYKLGVLKTCLNIIQSPEAIRQKIDNFNYLKVRNTCIVKRPLSIVKGR